MHNLLAVDIGLATIFLRYERVVTTQYVQQINTIQTSSRSSSQRALWESTDRAGAVTRRFFGQSPTKLIPSLPPTGASAPGRQVRAPAGRVHARVEAR